MLRKMALHFFYSFLLFFAFFAFFCIAKKSNVPMYTWWQEHAGDLLYPGARITNMDAIFKLMSIWNNHNMPNADFSDMLGVMTDFLLPQVSTSCGGILQCLLWFARK
jgi:formate hydrogenlyase subunit 4